MCSLINKQLLLTAYAYLSIMKQQEEQLGGEALQLKRVDRALDAVAEAVQLLPEDLRHFAARLALGGFWLWPGNARPLHAPANAQQQQREEKHRAQHHLREQFEVSKKQFDTEKKKIDDDKYLLALQAVFIENLEGLRTGAESVEASDLAREIELTKKFKEFSTDMQQKFQKDWDAAETNDERQTVIRDMVRAQVEAEKEGREAKMAKLQQEKKESDENKEAKFEQFLKNQCHGDEKKEEWLKEWNNKATPSLRRTQILQEMNAQQLRQWKDAAQ